MDKRDILVDVRLKATNAKDKDDKTKSQTDYFCLDN